MSKAVQYSAAGRKSTAQASLDKHIFGQNVSNHQLLGEVYRAYLAAKRTNPAKTKTRGQVRGGGRKPWRQKGLGRARHGSNRSPIWQGGGITFGPTGEENYLININKQARQKALRQALSLAAKDGKIKIVETYADMDKKTKDMVKFLDKVEAKGRVLCVVSKKDSTKEQAARNIPNLAIVGADYLNVPAVLDADTVLINQKALDIINKNLSNDRGARK